MKKNGPRGILLKDYLQSELKDPEFRRLYEDAGIELQVALEITRAREVAGMSQRQLAAAIKTKQQTVSRLEQGEQNITIGTLQKIARAVNRTLEVRFVTTASSITAFRGSSKDPGLAASLLRDRSVDKKGSRKRVRRD